MKKILFVLTLLAVFLLPGASIWEGAAAVSTDFPEKGLYVATNSFPRNTIVDLTNLETGKTVRVIVSAGLDAPGLLALVSREVAEEVGLQNRTIGRIRMTQPSDPIAFSRFTEDYLNSGDPDHDPSAAVNGAYPDILSDPALSALPGEGPAGASEAAAPAVPATPAAPAVSTVPAAPAAPAVPVVPPVTPTAPPPPGDSSVPEDTAGGANPGGPSRESERDPEEAWLTGPVSPAGTEPELPADIPETSDAVALAAAAAPEPVIEEVPEEAVAPSVPQVPPPLISGPVIVPVPVPIPVPAQPAPALQPEPAVQPEPPSGTSGGSGPAPGYNYTLIPAEDRPPEGSGPGNVPQIFSVPAVADLEQGKYYLQIGAYSKTEIVEQELAKVDGSYPLAVQCAGGAGRTVYRILIGPVNQGESGALLRNFRGRGYRDAFIRRGN
ncbi:MAG: SPOR domain-containing protein [Spirochaetaceae bacterium]|jgi:hypothetical protein|nr:SPOR domain-containing protein [Spirochaetaceae bacterium]